MVLTAHSSERFSYTRVQSIALDLNTNFTKTAVFFAKFGTNQNQT